MFRVLIVDDDFTTRTNLRTIIEWEKYGFEICGEATNGQNAIEMIKECLPDIVITDMSMPIMDGVALIEYIKENYKDIKSIALSGYEDFAYVKDSMKNGAVDYLLKHKLDRTVLLKVLNAATDTISQQHKQRRQFAQSKAILQHEFIRSLVLGDEQDNVVIQGKIKDLELPLGVNNFSLVAISIDDFQLITGRLTKAEEVRLVASVMNLTEDILRDMNNGVLTYLEKGKFVILFSFGTIRSQRGIWTQINTTVNRISVSIKRYLNITACFSIGKIFDHIENTRQMYQEAAALLNRKMIMGKDQVFRDVEPVQHTVDFFNLDVKDEKQIMLFLRTGDYEKVSQQLDFVFDKMLLLKVSYKSVQMICAELIGIANRLARAASVDVTSLYTNTDIPYDEMKKHETILDVKTWILEVYHRLIILLLDVDIKSNYSDLTKKVMEYIRQNYTKDISLHQTAENVGGNSSYLSRIFKEDCGIGFAEYLNKIRVRQAKHLMEHTDTKLKEIVQQVGFNNYTYFFKVFKVLEGVTPVEYKAKYKS